MAGGYNRKAVRPFLGEANPDYDEEDDYFRGRAAFPGTLQEKDRQYYYHATTMRNLASILQTGLDPQRGGIRGAGTLIAGDEDYREPDAENAQNPPQQGFNQDSHGYVFASEDPEVVVPYAFAYDDMADGVARAEGEIESAPVVLRFRKNILKKFEKDPAQPGAIMTRQPIRWDQLEILTEEGWTPLNQPLENDRLMRDEIHDNVSAILNAGRSATVTGASLGEPDQGQDPERASEAEEEMETEQGSELELESESETEEEMETEQGSEPELESESETEEEMDTVQAPAPKRPPELKSVSDLMKEEGMGQAGTTKKPGGAENSRDKSIGK